MEWITLSSTNLSRVRYEETTQTLEIEFQDGRIYQYFDVPIQIYEGLLSAESHGIYFHAIVKGQYRYVRI